MMKALFLLLAGLGLSACLSAQETWLDAGTAYAKPFQSYGYSGRNDDGLAGTLGVEELLGTDWALGLSYEALKIDPRDGDPAYQGLMNGTLRWMPWTGPLRPYARAQFGALAYSQSDDASEQRSGGPDAGLGLGLLLFTGQPWALDLGVDALRVWSHPSLDLLQGHAGLSVRFGSAPADF